MLNFVSKHGLDCKSEIYSFEDFPKALDKLENGRPHFRCVVNVEDYRLPKEIKHEHEIYKRVKENEADACAWVFSDKNTFEKYYYKHPELDPEDVRVRILSTGLCLSDSHTGRGLWGTPNYPICCGHEILGKVETFGSNVKKFK